MKKLTPKELWYRNRRIARLQYNENTNEHRHRPRYEYEDWLLIAQPYHPPTCSLITYWRWMLGSGYGHNYAINQIKNAMRRNYSSNKKDVYARS